MFITHPTIGRMRNLLLVHIRQGISLSSDYFKGRMRNLLLARIGQGSESRLSNVGERNLLLAQ
jgi:hypothetical protein